MRGTEIARRITRHVERLFLRCRLERVLERVRDQVFFGFEVPIEAAVRKPCGLHDLRDRDSLEAMLAKQPARSIQNLAPVRVDLFATDLHRLTVYMMTIMIANHDHCHDWDLSPELTMSSKSSVLITGASSGIGALYADRFAKRGHDLVLVARDRARPEALAAHLRAETGVAVDLLAADLTNTAELAAVEARVREDVKIEILVNNAGATIPGTYLDQTPDRVSQLIDLNVVSLARLTSAIAPRLAAAKTGAIINIGSVVGLAPEFGATVYGATKAFVLFLSQGLQLELGPKGVYVQAVLPAATRTEIWERGGRDINQIPNLMEVEDLVDAALVGFDRREAVTIPPLHEEEQWQTFDAARRAMLPGYGQAQPAPRYRS
jgi:uncharacterized protein